MDLKTLREIVEPQLTRLGAPDSAMDRILGTLKRNIDYLECANKSPLDVSSSFLDFETKIHQTVDLLSEYGLTLEQYVAAACKCPSLFYYPAQTVMRNITGTVDLLSDYGLTMEQYVAAACKQPQLFYQSPKTISTNFKTAHKSVRNGVVSKEVDLTGYFVNSPNLFALSQSNYRLRHVFAHVTNTRNCRPGAFLIKLSRKEAERAVVYHYGHDPDEKTIPPLKDKADYPSREARKAHRILVAMSEQNLLKDYAVASEVPPTPAPAST